MKKVLTLFAVLVVTGAVFARAIDEPSKESAIVFVKNGSVVKVVYSSDKESVARVTITDLKGKEVFSEIVRSKKGFSRPYPIHHPQDYRDTLIKLAQLSIDSFLLAHSGVHRIDALEILRIRESVPSSPRTHRSLLLILLKRLIKSKESTHPLK